MSKTILITGSTDGIGKLTAIQLAKDGHVLYLHGRNKDKLETVISEVKQASNNANVDGFVADFSDLGAVKQMAEVINSKLNNLDVLINNAGVFNSPVNRVEVGDIRIVVNYFAPFLITRELLPLLKKGDEARIVNLSSAAQSTVSIEAIEGAEISSINDAYAQSKLALTMWSFDLAKRLKNTSVIAVNPGSLLNTRMANEAYGQHWSPATKGSEILYELAVSEEYKGITGQYFDNDKGNPRGVFGSAHADAYNEVKILELISLTEGILNNY